MPITDYLDRNARLYPNDVSLVEINPANQPDKLTNLMTKIDIGVGVLALALEALAIALLIKGKKKRKQQAAEG